WQSAPTPGLKNLLRQYEIELNAAEARDAMFLDGHGRMTIEQWQGNLKKITFDVTWTKPDGKPGEFTQTVYLGADSNYGD
ncbi:MAG: hypothetical protein HZB20_01770, partial [Chloroflexi bacterium]|nr:hypothetical protein [Chloroflexota bacterium]